MDRVVPRPAVAPTPAVKPVVAPSVVPAAPVLKPAVPAARVEAIAKLKAIAAAEAKLPLQKGSESRTYLHDGPPPKGTLVMYHGFSAGSWQFTLLAEKAFAAGYDVIIPRLPGHGLKDPKGVEDPSQLPTSQDWRRYETFGEDTYQIAKGLGGPVSVLGLSVGANVALSVAEQHNDIQRVVAYAPFLNAPGFAGKVISTVQFLDKLTFGLAGKLLDFVPWGWGKACEAETASGKRPGHSKFPLGAIYSATELGTKLVKQGGAVRAPIQFFVTDVDDAADNQTIRKLHDRAGGDQRNGWFRFPAPEGVPHPMVHPMEDKGHGQTPQLYEDTLRFLETGLPIDRAEGKDGRGG